MRTLRFRSRSALAQVQAGRKARPVGRPAPVGGWNARDARDVMEPTDAIVLDNLIPGLGRVKLRRGYTAHSTGVGSGDVKTLAEFQVGTTRQLIAAGGGSIYNASADPAASLGSGFSENRWNWVVFDGKMGLCNGTDTPQQWDGTTLSTLTLTGTGLTATSVIGINVFRSRTYFWMKNSQDFWYSAVNTLGGALTKFPLSRVGSFGGNLIAVGTWNPAGGADWWGGGGTTPDQLVFVMSSGEVILYDGDDPGSNFAIRGVHKIGQPIDPRGILRIGGDLLILTKEGLQSLSKVVAQGRPSADTSVSDKIVDAIRVATQSWSGSTGWQLIYFPGDQLLILNVPRGGTTEFEQHVMNGITKAWCRFVDLNARCWGVYNDLLYWGDGSGNVRQYNGLDDNGTAIAADAQTAYDYLGDRGNPKTVTAMRPVLRSAGSVSVGIKAQIDHQVALPTLSTIAFSTLTNWEDIDVNWEDWEDDWDAGGLKTVAGWFAAGGTGYAISTRLKLSASDEVEWQATTLMLKPGQGMKGGGPV